MNAVPGLKELMVVGKIVHEWSLRRWDKIIVDLPASGHAREYLRMPQSTARAFSSGWAGRESKVVADILQDPAVTALLPVTLAEEMAVSELLEIGAGLQSEQQIAAPLAVVNKFPDIRLEQIEISPALLSGCGLSEVSAEWIDEIIGAYRKRQCAAQQQLQRLRALFQGRILVCGFSSKEAEDMPILKEIGG